MVNLEIWMLLKPLSRRERGWGEGSRDVELHIG